MGNSFFDSNLFTLGLIPFLIFLARICDVSIGTIRIIFVSKGNKRIAPILGFFEVLIWITAISKIMQNLDNYVNYVAYAAGFATGNFVGMIIEEKLAVGIQMIRIITHQSGNELVQSLNSKGYGATSVEAKGAKEKVHLIYSIVQRQELDRVIQIIDTVNPKAFYTIEDIRSVNEGIFVPNKQRYIFPFTNILRQWRKGK
ncbi:MAG TPA: DUF2179 domain-containing protein [Bacteroidales bacterium]|jgi:uncharacterized protein YebE (UPF0316 family)|nr:DUF2179 domain-containing protein [Bacteroidales bacterium]OQB64891.1 MAG: hypothetical protein BWX96_00387 [Bacteroidetes bacterium ADurb.Bin145]NMD03299.1 DUF2179 domain-containing protein [Bacteroidales bacterium]HOU02003.1 DUF2179 domain-containing protein [Bacteroidales bacterium]HQG64006.1 DUF2179 domain-containing protein [Bacteroidales bacterium]